MKLLRSVFSSFLLAAFAVSQMPSPGSCQMGFRFSPLVCRMPCCKTVPMPKDCPHLKVETPRDILVPSAPTLTKVQGVFLALLDTGWQEPPLARVVYRWTVRTSRAVLIVIPVRGRSPPPNLHLLSA